MTKKKVIPKGESSSSSSASSSSQGVAVSPTEGSSPQSSSKKSLLDEVHPAFSDISASPIQVGEEAALDARLAPLNLIRKKIPRDGSCLFSAVADQLCSSQTQHFRVRQKCVDFMQQHREDFEPFIYTEVMPFDHYLFEMRKVNTWGGQVELQALSLMFRVNFLIYSPNADRPTHVDNGFEKTIKLCYYGNHYDCVYDKKHFEIEEQMQRIVYTLVNKSLGISAPTPSSYKNIGWELWLDRLQKQTLRDKQLAEQLSNDGFKSLTGFYFKDRIPKNGTRSSVTGKDLSKRNPKGANTSPLLFQFKVEPNSGIDEGFLPAIEQKLPGSEEFPVLLGASNKPPKQQKENASVSENGEGIAPSQSETSESSVQNPWAAQRNWAEFLKQKRQKKIGIPVVRLGSIYMVHHLLPQFQESMDVQCKIGNISLTVPVLKEQTLQS